MKKLGLLVMPLIMVSLLVSCNKGNNSMQTTVTFSKESVGCTLCYNNVSYAKGARFKIPAGVDVTLTIEANQDYLPVFEDGLTVSEAMTYSFNPTKEEIKVKVANNGKCVIKAIAEAKKENLNAYSWTQLSKISETGLANKYFKVGDTKEIKLFQDGVEQNFFHTLRIIGFNHDDLADGSGKAGITFEFADLITKKDEDGTYYPYATHWDGGVWNYDYRDSILNTLLNDETVVGSVINMLPDDLAKEGIIKSVNKLVGVNETKTKGKENYKAATFDAKLFPLAYEEIHNNEVPTDYDFTPGEAGDGGIYEYYKDYCGDTDEDKAYRVKNIVDGSGGETYWLRSPDTTEICFAFIVKGDGNMGSSMPNYLEHVISPAFCI